MPLPSRYTFKTSNFIVHINIHININITVVAITAKHVGEGKVRRFAKPIILC
jgi:hypothetical protein